MKKWIAYSEGFAKGALHLNEQAVKVLKGQKAVSLLPVGAVSYTHLVDSLLHSAIKIGRCMDVLIMH